MLKLYLLLACLSLASALKCWTCTNAQDDDECALNGRVVTCQESEHTCETEIRRGGWGSYPMITKRCKQGHACFNNEFQNDQFDWNPTQCNTKIPSSVCKCCCHTDSCNAITSEDCGNPVIEKCGAKIDLTIVMDSSSSIGQSNWMQMKNFVKTLVGAFTLDREFGAAISVFRYNEIVDTTTQILMRHHPSDMNNLMSYINMIPYNGQGTKTGKAINHVTDVILAPGNGNRPDVRDVVVIITDGNAQDNVAAPAMRLRATGAKTFVVPIKFGGQLDMQQIRSMVDDEGFIFTDAIEGGFDALDATFAAQVTLRICNEPAEPPPDPCASGPCGPNGQCIAIDPITYTCNCEPGYEFRGGTCVELDPCESSPCGAGECVKIDGLTYRCKCPAGYEYDGATCIELDPCDGKPCGVGECTKINGIEYTCTCPPGYEFDEGTCIELDPCESSPCGAGTCKKINGLEYSCVCPAGYEFDLGTCIELDPCESSPCGVGTCNKIDGLDYTCTCPPGFEYDLGTCIELDPCESSPCGVGNCNKVNGLEYTCTCPPGFEFDLGTCIELDPCVSSPCGVGTCNKIDGLDYTCTCPPGFEYALGTCIELDPCESSPCGVGGCQKVNGLEYICVCPAGHEFALGTCIELDPCESSPCGVGTCNKVNGLDYTCTCPPGFEYALGTCVELDPCESSPCGVGGCQKINGLEYTCTCPAGHEFALGTCIELDPCESSPCGVGTCNKVNGLDYTCTCPPGFEYALGTCVELNPCESSPCGVGNCVKVNGLDYTCTCPAGYEFALGTCIELDPCVSSPCGVGTCNKVNGLDYTCTCPPGFEYDLGTCVELDPCESSPCGVGSCEKINGLEYSCVCPAGHEFDLGTCIELDPCVSSPCGVGTCHKVNGLDYTCTCPPGFEYALGTCVELDPCESSPCGVGECQKINGLEYSCVCPLGFEFKEGTCIELDPCESNPCGVGVCTKIDPFKYSCSCPEGFVFEKGTCFELRCPVLDELLYGEKSCNGNETKQGTVCSFTCTEENYSLHPKNREELECQTDGTWDEQQPCCARPCPDFAVMDLIVVMDSSSSVRSHNWVKMKKFVRTLLSGFAVAPDLAFLSVFRYNKKVDTKTQILLKDFPDNQKDLLVKFDKMPYNGSGTHTGQAIDHVTDVMLSPKNGNRKQVQDIVLIITDGASQDNVKIPSQRLRDTGAQVLVLPIKSGGRLDKQQIFDMAGPGNEDNIFWEAVEGGFEALDENFASKVTAGVCKDPCKSVFTEDDIKEIIENFKNEFQ